MKSHIEVVSTSITDIASMKDFNTFEAQLTTLPTLTKSIEAHISRKMAQPAQSQSSQQALQGVSASQPTRPKLQVVPSPSKQEQPKRREFVFACLAEETDMKAKDIQARATMQGFSLCESLISTYHKQFLELQSGGEVQRMEATQ